ncbi:HAMP domain-containing sensor histidine kinase [Mycolicibacterium sp. Y3]
MGGSQRFRSLFMPSTDGYGLARVVVAVRLAVVLSVAALAVIGPAWMRQHTLGTAVVLGAALSYAGVLMVVPRYEVRRTRFGWLVSALDATFTLTLIGLTGGAASPVVSVLALLVIASAARLTFTGCLVLAALVGAGYLAVVLMHANDAPVRADAALAPWVLGLWWALYAVFIAVLSGGLATLLEGEHQSRVRALVEAEAEHAAAEEERDLRARLLRSYEAQQEGLQVLLHEFRTPVSSLDALTATTAATPADREAAMRLAGRHARHLSDMLDALADVSLSRRPAFSTGRVRSVDLTDLITEAADSARIDPLRLRLSITGDVSAVRVDVQGLRRVLTNLLENAARHGRGLPIDVDCALRADELNICVLDRGPGVAEEDIGELTAKFVSLSDRRGTAGLGLWIVQQIIDALGGTLRFAARDGGGLTASFTVPVG